MSLRLPVCGYTVMITAVSVPNMSDGMMACPVGKQYRVYNYISDS